jgi:hypothetical protein
VGWFRRLRGTLMGSRLDDDFDEEARFHLEQRTQEYVGRGMPPDEAHREASRRLGNLPLVRDQARDVDTLSWLADLSHDVLHKVAGGASERSLRWLNEQGVAAHKPTPGWSVQWCETLHNPAYGSTACFSRSA